MSTKDLLFLLVSAIYFLGCFNLILVLPHRFEENIWKCNLGERACTRLGISVLLFGALTYFVFGKSYQIPTSFWMRICTSVFYAIVVWGLATYSSIELHRYRFVKRFLEQWVLSAGDVSSAHRLILHQHGCDRQLIIRDDRVQYHLGKTADGNGGIMTQELSRNYPKDTLRVSRDGEVSIHLVTLPLRRKDLMNIVRQLPGYTHMELSSKGERVLLK